MSENKAGQQPLTNVQHLAGSLLLGCLFPCFLAELPVLSYVCFVLFVCFVLHFLLSLKVNFKCRAKVVVGLRLLLMNFGAFLMGLAIFTVNAENYLKQRLDMQYANQRFLLQGKIIDFPKQTIDQQKVITKFKFELLEPVKKNDEKTVLSEDSVLMLSCYNCSYEFKMGQVWSVYAKLKPPKGLASWGAFDFEKFALANGIMATGYIQNKKAENIGTAIRWFEKVRLRYRQVILDKAQTAAVDTVANRENTAILLALLIGDKSWLTSQQWQDFKQTGTSHLMAISGLHITLVFLFASFVIRKILAALLWLLPARIGQFFIHYFFQHISLQSCSMVTGLCVAIFYALISGLSIPTQRAILMLIVVSFCLLCSQRLRLMDALSIALIVLLLIFPLSTLHIGFWLSFGAVMMIVLISLSQEKLYFAQVRLAMAMIPVSLLIFQELPLLSPIVNLLVIPLISFVVLPVSLLLSSLAVMVQENTTPLFSISWQILHTFIDVIQYILQSSSQIFHKMSSHLPKINLSLVTVVLSAYSVFLIVLWRLLILRSLLFLPIVIVLIFDFVQKDGLSKRQTSEYSLTVLDVGQGLATVIETQNVIVIVDAGNAFIDGDSAQSTILPFLARTRRKPIHTIVVSHADQDHIGGLLSLYEYSPETRILINNPQTKHLYEYPRLGSLAMPCYNKSWKIDGVDFEIFEQIKADHATLQKRNNRSCVLKVSSKYGTVLLPGDIERVAEHALVAKYPDSLQADILIAPHHGSKTSSSPVFLNQVKAKIAIISAAFFSPYGHPHFSVSNRLKKYTELTLNTASSGSIRINLKKDGIQVSEYRALHSRFWYSAKKIN